MTASVRCEIVTAHSLLVWDLPAAPRVGEFIREVDAHDPGHDADLDRAELVTRVLWHENGALTIDTVCEPYP